MDKLENMPYFSTNRFNNRFKYSFESCEDEKSYFNYNNRTDISEKEIDKNFVKSYLFSRHCINPYTMVEKNSQDYWRLRKIFEKKK